MKIVTWNVNSIRSRHDRVVAWLERHEPDVLALQETKVVDDDFPHEAIEALGYHIEVFGQKTYNGVALLSRAPAEDVVRGMPGDDEDAQRRVIAGTFDGVRVVNVYVPNGQSVESEKFPFKLAWLGRLRDYLDETPSGADLVLLGDFNIAPDDRDVYDPDAWRGKVLFHPKEHEALARISAWGLFDLFRDHHEEAGRFSWWDYRRLGFPKNKGLRIDLILGSASVRARCTACEIDRDERKGSKPSDHAPVWMTLS